MTKKVPGAKKGRPGKQADQDLLQGLKQALKPGQKEKDEEVLKKKEQEGK